MMGLTRRGFLARSGVALMGLFGYRVASASMRESESLPEPSSASGDGSGQPYRQVHLDTLNNGPTAFSGEGPPDGVAGKRGDVYYRPWDRDGAYGCKLYIHTGEGWSPASQERGWKL